MDKPPQESSAAVDLYSLVSFLQRSSSLKNLTIVGIIAHGHELVSVQRLQQVLYPLARCFATINCSVEGFTEYPTIEACLRSVASQHETIYHKHILHYASLVRNESMAYKAMTDISSTTSNLRQHSKLRGRMFSVFDALFEKWEDEQQLLEWANDMAPFLTKVYEDEADQASKTASKFWLTALKGFDAAHKERLRYFPE